MPPAKNIHLGGLTPLLPTGNEGKLQQCNIPSFQQR